MDIVMASLAVTIVTGIIFYIGLCLLFGKKRRWGENP